MSILDRYLSRIILHYTLLAMLVLVGLFAFVNFLEQLNDIGQGEYGLREAAWYVALTLPRIVYELFPLSTLLGTILGLSLLANDSELVVMRASGISVLQIVLSALKLGGLLVIATIMLGELVAPHSETKAQRNRAAALQHNIEQQTDSGLWMRDAQTYVSAAEVLPDLTLLRIKIFEFNSDKKLRQLIFAESGQFKHGSWTLNKVKKTVFDAHGNANTSQMESSTWQSAITQQILSVFLVKPAQLSLWQLHRYIRHLAENQQQTAVYRLAFWNKLMLPLSTAVMIILAIPFVFVHLRSAAVGRSLFTGIMLGLGFYAIHKGFGYIALAAGVPPLLGATLPLLAFVLLAVVKLRTVQ